MTNIDKVIAELQQQVRQRVNDHVAKLRAIRCPVHGKKPRVVIKGAFSRKPSWMLEDCCCERVRKLAARIGR